MGWMAGWMDMVLGQNPDGSKCPIGNGDVQIYGTLQVGSSETDWILFTLLPHCFLVSALNVT